MSTTTRQRLQNLIELLLDHPEGLTTPEIANYFDVTRQTALNDINRLSADGIPIIEVEGTSRYAIIRTDYLKNIRLTLAQAWFLYLPLRRIVRANMHRYPLVRGLLHRITGLLHDEIGEQLLSDREENLVNDDIFIQLVSAWHEQQYVQVQYRPLNSPRISQFAFAPWWFEPAVWSDGFYVIGRLKKGKQEAITLKLDRIQSITLIADTFQRPAGKFILEQLSNSWGIWVSNPDGIEVELKFHNRQYDRLKETRWHPTERIEIDIDGAILWRAFISEPQEMLPWIRGWGVDVEVIKPENIREQIMEEAKATVRLYQQDWDDIHPPNFF